MKNLKTFFNLIILLKLASFFISETKSSRCSFIISIIFFLFLIKMEHEKHNQDFLIYIQKELNKML